MKTSKFTEERIAFTLKQAEMGTPVKEVIRTYWGQVLNHHFLSPALFRAMLIVV